MWLIPLLYLGALAGSLSRYETDRKAGGSLFRSIDNEFKEKYMGSTCQYSKRVSHNSGVVGGVVLDPSLVRSH